MLVIIDFSEQMSSELVIETSLDSFLPVSDRQPDNNSRPLTILHKVRVAPLLVMTDTCRRHRLFTEDNIDFLLDVQLLQVVFEVH